MGKLIDKIINNPIIFWSILCVMLGLCYYGLYRNNQVLCYRSQLSIQRMFVDIEYHDEFVEKIYNRYTYNEFFFSFKPLKSKYWFTEEEVMKYKLELVDEAIEVTNENSPYES